MRIALAQLNTTVGDIAGNEALVLEAYRRGVEAQVELVLTPELSLTGYPPRDLLLRESFIRANQAALERLAAAVGEVGFVSTRFSASEGSSSGHVQVRLWRTLNTRNAATITYKLEGTAEALAALGGESQRTAEFQPGDSQIFVSIPVINDTETQGYREITMTIESSSDGMKTMNFFATTVLTLADDETKPEGAALSIMEGSRGEGQRGVALSTMVPRGYQVLLEFSDSSLVGPWEPYWIFHGSDVEQVTFNQFDASLMRMFRIKPPEPLDITLPW